MSIIVPPLKSNLILLVAMLFIPLASFSQTITFNDTDPEIMVLDNGSSYEMALFKLTGAFSYIKDKSANVTLTNGETFDFLWSVEFFDGSTVRSTDYYPGEPDDFSYSWDDSQKALTLTYTPDPTASVKVNVLVTVALNESNYFDLQIDVSNEGSGVIRYVYFPNSIYMSLGTDDRVVFPVIYPGIMYGSEFFDSGESVEFECDFISYRIGEGNLAVYQLYNDTCIQTVVEGLYGDPDAEKQENYLSSFRYYTWIEEGDSWISQVTRFLVGQTPLEAIQSFRTDNAIDDYPSVEEKLGNKFSQYASSPFYTYSFPHYDPPGYYYRDVQDQLKYYPDPAILFFSMYFQSECANCSGYVPDYFPPEPILGTLEDFQDMITTMQSQGFLIMLSTNPNFWHAESPTILNLPEGTSIEDISVIDWNGEVDVFDPEGQPHYYISLTSPFVQQKFEEIYHILFEIYGTDMIYEDAAANFRIYNFNENEISPLHNRQEWIDYYKEHSNYPIVPEGAIVPMCESVTGIIGTSYEDFDRSDKGWNYATDDGYWRPYPLVSRMFRDKVIPYPSAGVFTENKDAVAWSTFFGCPFQIDLDEMSERPYWIIEEHDGWIPVIHEFQGRVTSRFIGKQLIDYLDLEGTATQADYGDIITVRNWDPDNPYSYDLHSIAPQGVYVRNESGDLEAGIFSRYNGADLSPGDHYLIVETFTDSMEVRHPMGLSTPIQVSRPAGWTDTQQINIYSITRDSIKRITPSFGPDLIHFQLKEAIPDTSRILKYLVLYGDTLQITSSLSSIPEMHEMDCYPNPFTERTRIRYEVVNPGRVLFKVMDLSGKEVRIIRDNHLNTGSYTMEWDGKDGQGMEVPSGMYFIYCIQTDGRWVNKIIKL